MPVRLAEVRGDGVSYTCCDWPDMVTDDDGGALYPNRCECICHTRDDE